MAYQNTKQMFLDWLVQQEETEFLTDTLDVMAIPLQWTHLLPPIEAIVLGYIQSLCFSRPFAQRDSKTLSRELNLTLKKFREVALSLKNKNLLVYLKFFHPRRDKYFFHYVPFCYALKYAENILPLIPEEWVTHREFAAVYGEPVKDRNFITLQLTQDPVDLAK